MGGSNFQPASVRRGMQDKIDVLKAQIDPDANPLAKSQVMNWENQMQALRHQEKQLDNVTPPDIKNGDERKDLKVRTRQLVQAMVDGSEIYDIPPMPSVGQMQDNPDYSTDQHRRWEQRWKHYSVDEEGKLQKSKKGYGAIFEYKDNQYRLFKQDEEEGTAANAGSIENFRPGKRVPLADNHAPVSFALGKNLSQEQYDDTFPDHEPLPGEVAAGVYFEDCVLCGDPVADKVAPFCSEHS